MSVSAVSSSSVAALYAAPSVRHQQPASMAQQAPKGDTVSISPQALKLASDGDAQAQEIRESGAEKGRETARGKA